ncbi:MAG TPA: hypothetical protein VLU25_05455 [Acidobacteriota bacterium]|nr:hypothetical protein [Acidobacteriota bacterium]
MSGLEDEFPGRVNSKNVDATTPESKEAVAQLGFRNHGIVIRSAQGDVLWTQPDHEVQMEDVRAKLRELTAE